jgi:LytS/YehU family sensor histidine kinase
VLREMLVVAMLVLLAFSAAGAWQPPGVPRWANQVLAVVVATPLATLLLYMGLVRGEWAQFVGNRGLVHGYIAVTVTVLLIAPLLALVALYRERDAQARNQSLRFELERSTLEKQALDARLKLLHAQIEPHFLFNTLANVQELVESRSDQAGPVLKSLIAYLRAAMPRLDDDEATLGGEVALVRAYLELMHMRMPDRLRYAIRVPGELLDQRIPSMAMLTLVENAIRHGIDPAERGGEVDVQAWRDAADGSVHLAVTDSGAGLRDTATPGTGLANLRARLQAQYGASARLELSEIRPHGVRAEIVCGAAVVARAA